MLARQLFEPLDALAEGLGLLIPASIFSIRRRRGEAATHGAPRTVGFRDRSSRQIVGLAVSGARFGPARDFAAARLSRPLAPPPALFSSTPSRVRAGPFFPGGPLRASCSSAFSRARRSFLPGPLGRASFLARLSSCSRFAICDSTPSSLARSSLNPGADGRAVAAVPSSARSSRHGPRRGTGSRPSSSRNPGSDRIGTGAGLALLLGVERDPPSVQLLSPLRFGRRAARSRSLRRDRRPALSPSSLRIQLHWLEHRSSAACMAAAPVAPLAASRAARASPMSPAISASARSRPPAAASAALSACWFASRSIP